jgi:hypothetical protein
MHRILEPRERGSQQSDRVRVDSERYASILLLGAFPAPARASTYTVTSKALFGGARTFEQALTDAKPNPGIDTITFIPGLVVNAVTSPWSGPSSWTAP